MVGTESSVRMKLQQQKLTYNANKVLIGKTRFFSHFLLFVLAIVCYITELKTLLKNEVALSQGAQLKGTDTPLHQIRRLLLAESKQNNISQI